VIQNPEAILVGLTTRVAVSTGVAVATAAGPILNWIFKEPTGTVVLSEIVIAVHVPVVTVEFATIWIV
jgi:hypothetical protein